MNPCICLDPRVFGHVWPCPEAVRARPSPRQAAKLLAAIKRIQEGTS